MGIVLFLLTITAKAQNSPSDYDLGKYRNAITNTPNDTCNSALTLESKKGQLKGDLELKEELYMYMGIAENDIIDYLLAYGCDIYLFLGIIDTNTNMK